MTRSEHLLKLIDLFRNCRRAITDETLAEALEVSPYITYRDIQALRNQGRRYSRRSRYRSHKSRKLIH